MITKKMGITVFALIGTVTVLFFQNCGSNHLQTYNSLNSVETPQSSQSVDSNGSPSTSGNSSQEPVVLAAGSCSLSVNVSGESTSGNMGPMGSKVTYLLTFADAATKSRARSLTIAAATGPSNNLNPIEESDLKKWSKWMNIANSASSLTVFQIINTDVSPNITAPGFYSRQLDVLDANNQIVCKTNSVSLTISADVLRRNLSELISKAASRYSIHSAANETTKCKIVHQADVKESSRQVSSLNDVVNSYNECRTQCQNEISANSKNFTNAKNPNFPQTLNGCEFSAPLLFSANGNSRAVVLKERIITVVDIGTLHGMGIYSLPMQTQLAQYGMGHWAGVNIFEILGGTNIMATDMYLDWNIRAPQEVETSTPYSLF